MEELEELSIWSLCATEQRDKYNLSSFTKLKYELEYCEIIYLAALLCIIQQWGYIQCKFRRLRNLFGHFLWILLELK